MKATKPSEVKSGPQQPVRGGGDARQQIEELARKHGTGGWQTLDDMVSFGLAVQALPPAQPAPQAQASDWAATAARIQDVLHGRQAQGVEPAFFTAWADSNGPVPLPGFSNETEKGVKSLVLQHARTEGYKGTVAGYLLNQRWWIGPVYAAPPSPVAQPEALPAQGADARKCPHCNYTGSMHCGDVAEKYPAGCWKPKDCSHYKFFGPRAAPQPAAARVGLVTLRARIKELISEHGTLRAVSRSLGLDVGYLSRLEHGEKVNPSHEVLAKLGMRNAGVMYERLCPAHGIASPQAGGGEKA